MGFSMSVAMAQIQPKKGESYSSFVYRAHKTLRDSEPDAYRRNQMVWDEWNSFSGNPLRSRAQEYFPSDQYRFVEAVPYFMEHTVEKPTGPLTYDYRELSRMVDNLNSRCKSDSYSALVSHHTDDRLKGPDKEPEVLGYSGPFYLGQVPTSNGDKWAIFGDEHHDHQHSDVFAKRRRRSVEVLRPRNGDPSYFDPIATLGADSPRLPLPVARYESKQDADTECVGVYSIDGTDMERYTMSSAPFSAVGQGNTFVPGAMQKDRYEPMGDPGFKPTSGATNLSPDDVSAIVSAIMQTPQMQWVAEQMEAGDPQQSQMGEMNTMSMQDSSQAMPPMQSQPAPPPMQNGDPQQNQYAAPVVGALAAGAGRMLAHPATQAALSLAPSLIGGKGGSSSGGGTEENYSNYSYSATSQEDDVNVERYAQIENELIESRDRYAALHAQHESLANANKQLFDQYAALQQSFTNQQQKLIDNDRYSQIKALQDRYDLVDVETEAEKCLYSKGSKMTDEEFFNHLSYVEKYAAKAQNRPPIGMIPDGVVARKPMDAEAEERISKLVVDRYSHEASRGVYRDYDEIRAEVVKELGAG